MRRAVCTLLVCVFTAGASVIAQGRVPDMAERARAAERVVEGRVIDVEARFGTSPAGDQLIYSDVLIEVRETLKGAPASLVTVTVEGGTIGDISLQVSDMPPLRPGERALLFLARGQRGEWVPHRRGLGIVRIGAADRVEGGALSLAEAKALVRKAAR